MKESNHFSRNEHIRVALLGAGRHSVSVLDLVQSFSNYEVFGCFDNRLSSDSDFHGHRILGGFSDVPQLLGPSDHIVPAIGQIGLPGIRREVFLELERRGVSFLTLVAFSAYVSQFAEIGSGTQVFHNATVNASARIGSNCIINTGSIIEHGVHVGSHTHISTGAILNGDSIIGEGSFVGSGAIVFQGVKLPEFSVVPAGAIVRDADNVFSRH